MSEIVITISPTLKKKYRIDSNRMNFQELEEKIRLANARDNLDRVVKIAKETGLSKMTNKEIDQIIKEVRQNARSSR